MDALLILFLILLNGAFAMSELALASSRKARLLALAESGDRGAQTALNLMDNPTQFLSSVQVGITSIGMLNGIVGEAAYSDDLAAVLLGWGLSEGTASVTSTVLVVLVITFITIVFGELVPKRIGQIYPETVSRWIARPMTLVAQATKPFVWLLTHTTQATLKLLRIDNAAVQQVTEAEIDASLQEGVGAGIIEVNEHQMVRNVFLLDDRPLTSIMVPRPDVLWLDAAAPLAAALDAAQRGGHSWYPVCRGGLHEVLGVIHLPQLVALAFAEQGLGAGLGAGGAAGGDEAVAAGAAGATAAAPHWASQARAPVFVPETLSGMEMLEQFRARATRMAFVVDEYGEVQGVLTPLDLLEAITGELSPETPLKAWATPQPDGSWLVDGAMPAHELKVRLGIDELPDENKERYNTVGGLMQTVAGELLDEGEAVEVAGWQFTVQRLDGRRIDEVRVRRVVQVSASGA